MVNTHLGGFSCSYPFVGIAYGIQVPPYRRKGNLKIETCSQLCLDLIKVGRTVPSDISFDELDVVISEYEYSMITVTSYPLVPDRQLCMSSSQFNPPLTAECLRIPSLIVAVSDPAHLTLADPS